MVRPRWADLSGEWAFAYDDSGVGVEQRWFDSSSPFDRTIVVPFPPESGASGIGDNAFHPVVWYRREIASPEVERAGRADQGGSVLLHFGAVDYRATVWLNETCLGSHEGGSTPFSFDITAHLSSIPMVLTLRVEDDPLDVAQPRGKQDWQKEPHGIWYKRTTGIWQQVWLEAVPKTNITRLAWTPDVPSGAARLAVELNERPQTPVQVSVHLTYDNETLASLSYTQADPRGEANVLLSRQANGQAYESLLWSPENPRLIDATISVTSADGSIDTVRSYFGMRSVGWTDGHFMLNDRPYYVRAVLEQGYWQDTHLAAPSAQALRDEVRLIKDLGFNSARIHEKVEDPRFLYWADRLGLLIWSELPSAYEFSHTAVQRSTSEWMETIRRDFSHPCIVVWVPLNESWGVQHISHSPAQLSYTQALYHLTKAFDPSRLVISNDGWEHAESDILSVHDYGITREELTANYHSKARVQELLAGIGPLGRTMQLSDRSTLVKPVIVSEFGGISYVTDHEGSAWGYATASDPAEYEFQVRELFEALQSSPALAGFCYTQLTDTLQEANGLTDPHRNPKIPVETIRSIVRGDRINTAGHGRPKTPIEQPHQGFDIEAKALASDILTHCDTQPE